MLSEHEDREIYGRKNLSFAKAIFKENLEEIIHHDQWILVDIRQPEDFAKGHLCGAINIITQQDLQDILQNNPDKNILLNCYSGYNVSVLGSELVKQGYTNIYYLDQNIEECL